MGTVALAALITVTTAYAVLVLPRMNSPVRRERGWARHPGFWLLVVTALLFVNQVLFTVYVWREWHGDVSRIARYLPAGWFALADPGRFADAFPAPGLLSPTVLRVQAFLELPFVLLAYLTVCRWCGAPVFGRALAARWAVSASYTATFCLIEWSLHNPYTTGDLVLRALSGLLVPIAAGRLAPGPDREPRLVPLVVSLAALGSLVLAVYDTALLYNLAHATAWLPWSAFAIAVLAGARWWAARGPGRAGPAIGAVCACLGWFLLLFFVPALPLRYGLNFGTTAVSLACGAVLVARALWLGWPRELARTLALAVLAGCAGATAGDLLAHGLPEARLLAAAAGFMLAGGAVCAITDRKRRRVTAV
ncbi:hypothetical protein FNH05_16430 [Amycolatopsis rhizosphaerae]|uniref:Uncharacterized protein n=1 Tax=Amycolatopsis rhizosphaerae TaxID=2053003 RepID=A0A558CMK0_9PSEU|nr:hypothetical protein [Amycolatopsis rhizosphaerae]TVT49932.1 hypothetical protein FNH05_16430 [Amycolatopsis rhizosphaerae]